MGLLNLLAVDVEIGLFGQTFDVYLNWIGKIIKFLIEGVGVVGVGIVLFSLVLKLITLPFDIYQRISMRKQNIKMKENQARMEKLQKQYANDKNMYNQKVMEMYKENGISMFSSCLPMILSLVIFFVAINAFNAFSQYSNIQNYNTMVNAYNARMESYCADLTEENVTLDGNVITVKDAAEDKYIYYTVTLGEEENVENPFEYAKACAKSERVYFVDVEKAYANEEVKAAVAESLAQKQAENESNGVETTAAEKEEIAKTAIKNYFIGKAQDAVVEIYDSEVKEKTQFLWIKNIWVTDASYKHPVLDWSSFKSEISRSKYEWMSNAGKSSKIDFNGIQEYTNVYDENGDTYGIVTAKLTTAKSESNGWYILVALSIGTILLQQFVSMRSQKEQQKYSTVDGQAASSQKMTMVIMTGMFAIFSFMYSSAFSIYLITSNLFSLVSTLVINKLVDSSENKKAERALQEKHNQRFPGRVSSSANGKNASTDKKNRKK